MSNELKSKDLCVGQTYNFQNQSERLEYLGYNWSGNGYWHQFEKISEPGVVWCEVQNSELALLEKTV